MACDEWGVGFANVGMRAARQGVVRKCGQRGRPRVTAISISAIHWAMTTQARPSARPTPAESPDDSVTVAVASRRLGCDPTTVRALLRCRELSGHRVGKGKDPKGVRVHVASIRDYIARHSVCRELLNDNAAIQPSPHLRRRSPAHDAAMAQLQALGVAVRKTL
jgi:hypothetical protein